MRAQSTYFEFSFRNMHRKIRKTTKISQMGGLVGLIIFRLIVIPSDSSTWSTVANILEHIRRQMMLNEGTWF